MKTNRQPQRIKYNGSYYYLEFPYQLLDGVRSVGPLYYKSKDRERSVLYMPDLAYLTLLPKKPVSFMHSVQRPNDPKLVRIKPRR